MTYKDNVNINNLPSQTKSTMENSVAYKKGKGGSGIGISKMIEPYPEFAFADGEKMYKNGNAYIMFGRDRPASKMSGYGGRGDTSAFTIDVVVGRMSGQEQSVSTEGERIFCDPNFKIDASRIYISQKTDVDENFGLITGVVGDSKSRAAIAIKSDAIRIIAREGIKLVTKTDLKNSQGGDIVSVKGIDLIAGNDDSELQPMVLGNNLTESLDVAFDLIDQFMGNFTSYLQYQMKFNSEIMQHYHISPFFGAPTSPSQTLVPAGITCMSEQAGKTLQAIASARYNLRNFKFTYLTPAGARYINSKFNNVN
tara:strand:+ start:31395 stop:32324 length:930 start_codon:yes stop_codon:yes gene_type:complete